MSKVRVLKASTDNKVNNKNPIVYDLDKTELQIDKKTDTIAKMEFLRNFDDIYHNIIDLEIRNFGVKAKFLYIDEISEAAQLAEVGTITNSLNTIKIREINPMLGKSAPKPNGIPVWMIIKWRNDVNHCLSKIEEEMHLANCIYLPKVNATNIEEVKKSIEKRLVHWDNSEAYIWDLSGTLRKIYDKINLIASVKSFTTIGFLISRQYNLIKGIKESDKQNILNI